MFLKKLGKRGVAMTEYAVLLAFVAAVAGSFTSDNGLASSITAAIGKAENAINMVMGKTSQNKVYDTKMADDSIQHLEAVDGLMNGILGLLGDDLNRTTFLTLNIDSNGQFTKLTYWYDDPVNGNTKKEITDIDPNSFFGNTGYVLASGNTQLIMENGNIKAVNHPEPYQQATRLQFKDAEGNKLYGHYSDSTGTFYVNKNYGYDPNR